MLLSDDHSVDDRPLSLSYRVISAVADREGVDPTEIEPPEYQGLYEVCNPEALDALFAPRESGQTRTGGVVSFTFCGYDVTVSDAGEVTLEE